MCITHAELSRRDFPHITVLVTWVEKKVEGKKRQRCDDPSNNSRLGPLGEVNSIALLREEAKRLADSLVQFNTHLQPSGANLEHLQSTLYPLLDQFGNQLTAV